MCIETNNKSQKSPNPFQRILPTRILISPKVRIVHASPSISGSDTSSGFSDLVKRKRFNLCWIFSHGFALNPSEKSNLFVVISALVDMNSLVRRKQVDSVHLINNDGHHQLAKKLTAVDLVAIGMRKIQTFPIFVDQFLRFCSYRC